MSEALSVTKNKQGDVLFIYLNGVITEDSQLELVDSDGEATLVLDLQGITRINSYGIRQWINNLKRLKEKSPNLIFTRCPPMVIEQFNMISNFGAEGVVQSFYLPFYSEKLEKSELILTTVTSDLVNADHQSIIDRALKSLNAADEYVFNDIEDEYFTFLQHQKSKSVDAKVATLIEQLCK